LEKVEEWANLASKNLSMVFAKALELNKSMTGEVDLANYHKVYKVNLPQGFPVYRKFQFNNTGTQVMTI
jgi:hypothetical protein